MIEFGLNYYEYRGATEISFNSTSTDSICFQTLVRDWLEISDKYRLKKNIFRQSPKFALFV